MVIWPYWFGWLVVVYCKGDEGGGCLVLTCCRFSARNWGITILNLFVKPCPDLCQTIIYKSEFWKEQINLFKMNEQEFIVNVNKY